MTTIIDQNQLPPTSTEDPLIAAGVCIIQSENAITSSHKTPRSKYQNDYRHFNNILDDYVTYNDDFIRIFKQFK